MAVFCPGKEYNLLSRFTRILRPRRSTLSGAAGRRLRISLVYNMDYSYRGTVLKDEKKTKTERNKWTIIETIISVCDESRWHAGIRHVRASPMARTRRHETYDGNMKIKTGCLVRNYRSH